MDERKGDPRTIFFDIGGVLFDFNEKPLHALIGDLAGVTREDVDSVLRFDIQSHEYHKLWENFEKSWIGLAGFCDGVKDLLDKKGLLKKNFSVDDFREVFIGGRLFEPLSAPIFLAKALKDRGHTLGIISNINEDHWAFLSGRYPHIFSWFKIKVLSYEIGFRKPETKIWNFAVEEALLADENTVPEGCIFIDDREENIISAERYGINAIHFRGYVDPLDELIFNLRGLGVWVY